MKSEYNLPNGWELVAVEDFATTSSGGTPKRGNQAYYGGEIPWVKSGELRDGEVTSVEEFITVEGLANSSAKIFPKGTLCIAMYGATVGKLGVLGMDASTNQAVCALFPHEGIDVDFLRYFFRGKREELIAMGKGGAQPNISQTVVKEFPVCLPPSNEQRRIADKIDALQAKSRRAREALETVGPLLEKFRQSVLAAAFRGDLTAEWRKQHPDVEPADKLLERIRAERRTRWEEAELAKMRAKGKKPKDDKWKAKYTEPEPVDTSELPELPKGWCWASLEAVTDPVRVIRYGILKPGPDVEGGIPYVKVLHMRGDVINTTALPRTTPEIFAKYKAAALGVGDVLLSIRGTYGRVAEVPDELDGANITQDSARIAPLGGVNKHFLSNYLRSPLTQMYFAKIAKGVAVKGINIRDIRPWAFPVAPEAEQEEIARKAKQMMETVATQSEVVSETIQHVGIFDQSILAKAFRGELVSQDPNDDPASVLLERIKAERTAAKGKKKRKA